MLLVEGSMDPLLSQLVQIKRNLLEVIEMIPHKIKKQGGRLNQFVLH